MQSQNNLTEIGLIVISSLAIIGAVVLLFTGKIDYVEGAGLISGVFVLWGGTALYKAPSPLQQATFQQLLSDVLQVLPTFVGAMHSHLPEPVMQAPVAPPQAPQTAAPLQSAMQSSQPVAPVGMPTTTMQPPAQPPRDAWSNSALMQAIGKPPQQQQ